VGHLQYGLRKKERGQNIGKIAVGAKPGRIRMTQKWSKKESFARGAMTNPGILELTGNSENLKGRVKTENHWIISTKTK